MEHGMDGEFTPEVLGGCVLGTLADCAQSGYFAVEELSIGGLLSHDVLRDVAVQKVVIYGRCLLVRVCDSMGQVVELEGIGSSSYGSGYSSVLGHFSLSR